MEPEQARESVSLERPASVGGTATPPPKYLAMALFVTLSLIGGWVWYSFAPENFVRVERISVVKVESDARTEGFAALDTPTPENEKKAVSPLVFIDPNGDTRLSRNLAFPVRWSLSRDTNISVFDLYLNSEDSECKVASNVVAFEEVKYVVPALECELDTKSKYFFVAKVREKNNTSEILGISDAFAFEDANKESIQRFSKNQKFIFEKAGISFIPPENAVSIVKILDWPHPPRSTFEPEHIQIFYGDGTIDISADAYFGEWNAGVPIAEISSSAVEIAGQARVLRIYDTYDWNEGDGYGNWEKLNGRPFAVLFIDSNGDSESDVMIDMSYMTDSQKQAANQFVRSITLVE